MGIDPKKILTADVLRHLFFQNGMGEKKKYIYRIVQTISMIP